jgi:PTS system cellobiose-specific IIB component
VTASSADVILVGPHLAERAAELREVLSVPLLVLPDDVFSDRDGRRTLALVRAAVADDPALSEGTS